MKGKRKVYLFKNHSLINKVFAIGCVACFVLVFALLLYPILTTPLALSATKGKPPSSTAIFDYKFLLNLLVFVGSMLGFAFYVGGRLGKIEENIIHIKEENNAQKDTCNKCLDDGKEARKELWQEVNNTKERVTILETRVGA